MPYFGQEILEMAVKKGPLSEEAYTKAVEKRIYGALKKLREDIKEI